MSEEQINEYAPINRQNLAGVIDKVKKVVNPTFLHLYPSGHSYFGLVLDCEAKDLSTGESIELIVTGRNIEGKMLSFIGHFYKGSTGTITGINLGTTIVNHLAYADYNGAFTIAITTSDSLSEISAEVFTGKVNDNKNHCSGIIQLTEFIEHPTDETDSFPGDSPVNWGYKIEGKFENDTNPDVHEISINPGFAYKIVKIAEAYSADRLKDPIHFDVYGSNIALTDVEVNFDNLELLEDGYHVDFPIMINMNGVKEDLEEYIENDYKLPFAEAYKRGGIQLYDSQRCGAKPDNRYDVKIDRTEGKEYAYVDLSKFKSDSDIHRYSNMTKATELCNVNAIVEYIGPTTSEYTFGYFYLKTNSVILVKDNYIDPSSVWTVSTNIDVVNLALNKYNKEHNYALTAGYASIPDITISIIPEGSDESSDFPEDWLFVLDNGNGFSEFLTYELVCNLGLELKPSYVDDYLGGDYDLTIQLEYDESQTTWVLKNVLPALSVENPLHYKGLITWDLLIRISNADRGDFYTVEDRDLQEYWWNGTEWEYLGEVFEPNYTSKEDDKTTSVAVGGIPAGTKAEDLTGKDVSVILDMILFPDLLPTISGLEKVVIKDQLPVKFGNSFPTLTKGRNDATQADANADLRSYDRKVTYSKQVGSTSILLNATYSGAFSDDVKYTQDGGATFIPQPSKVLTDTEVDYIGTWALGDKVPCTKKGNPPTGTSTVAPANTSTASKTIKCWFPYFYGAIDSIPTASTLKLNETFVTNKLDIEISLSGKLKYHFIAIPYQGTQLWEVNTVATKAGYDCTGNFSLNNLVTVEYTNNNETISVPMKLTYLYNPTSNSVEYKITLK